MTLVFTICSSNYLAHAKVLGDSLAESNPDCRFVIGLVDSIPTEIDLATWISHEVVPVTEIGIADFDEMSEKYNIVELNTAVKPFYMDYFYKQDEKVDHVIYLDPDIVVYNSLSTLTGKLATHNMIVTPHSCTYDNSEANMLYEISMLMTGVYNLGFIATTRSDETSNFLTWWQIRLREYCYYATEPGLFVDQIWLTLAHLYFKGFYVEKDPGYNMSYWNLFERTLSRDKGRYMVNSNHQLIFYHYSSYKVDNPLEISSRKTQPVATFQERPDMQSMFDDYHQRLINAGYDDVSSIQCAHGRKEVLKPHEEPKLLSRQHVKNTAKSGLHKLLRIMPKRINNILARTSKIICDSCRD